MVLSKKANIFLTMVAPIKALSKTIEHQEWASTKKIKQYIQEISRTTCFMGKESFETAKDTNLWVSSNMERRNKAF